MMTTTQRPDLRLFTKEVQQRAIPVVERSAERFVNYCAALCPYDRQERDDFHMVEHIEVRFDHDRLGYQGGFFHDTFAKFGQPDYYIFTEFGTTTMHAQPCVFPARDLEEPDFLRDLDEILGPSLSS